jgi:nitrogenase molybdenum-iron protein alpha/beta subunit
MLSLRLFKHTNKMKELLELLGDKFDEYHTEQLKLSETPNADYYLFMGKANAIGEIMDIIETLESK